MSSWSSWPLRRGPDHAHIVCRLLEQTGAVTHGVTCRRGNLRLSASTEPDLDRLFQNRTQACGIFDSMLVDCCIPTQTHGNRVDVVHEGDRGRGGWPPDSGFPASDALITNVPGILLGVTIADCLPVFLYDRAHRAIGLAHSGWRGTARSIALNTIEAMRREYRTDAVDVVAGIGPGICEKCYEVGYEVREQLQAAGATDSAFQASPAGRWMLDLRSVVVRQLRSAGLHESAISVAPWCTSCHNYLFFSHRKEGPSAGRMGAFIKLVPDSH